MTNPQEMNGSPVRRRRIASVIIIVVDLALVAWGAMAALLPQYLLGPKGAPILPAGYEGFTGRTWQQIASDSPDIAGYISLLFRTYGAYCLTVGLFGVALAATAFRRGDRLAWWALLVGNTVAFASAMRYDWLVKAIGPFELTEYLGLALIWAALAMTAPIGRTEAHLAPTLGT